MSLGATAKNPWTLCGPWVESNLRLLLQFEHSVLDTLQRVREQQ